MKNLLIVEDVDSMRALLELVFKELCRRTGRYNLTGMAQNGAEARFELVRRRPDLLLLDEILPGESALDLLEEFRAQAIPVVLLTSLESRPTEEPLPVGASGRVYKPTWKAWQNDPVRVLEKLTAVLDQVP